VVSLATDDTVNLTDSNGVDDADRRP